MVPYKPTSHVSGAQNHIVYSTTKVFITFIIEPQQGPLTIHKLASTRAKHMDWCTWHYGYVHTYIALLRVC